MRCSRRRASRCGRQGEPLDVAAFLRTAAGKPRVSIFSIAHLDDTPADVLRLAAAQRGCRLDARQIGTSSLRAMVYMDEIFGYFPPAANPPSKGPLLTLLKQGRAAGVGVVLATQNPVDLDYKGLSNIGTWWLGRLQTERDKARLLDGLEGAERTRGLRSRRKSISLLSGLTSRVFLMRNVHEDGLTLFQSRWALSLPARPARPRRHQEADRGAEGVATGDRSTCSRRCALGVAARLPGAATATAAVAALDCRCSDIRSSRPASSASSRPIVPPDVPQYFSPDAAGGPVPLIPVVYGAANVRFTDTKAEVDATKLVTWTAPITDGAVPVDWEAAAAVEVAPEHTRARRAGRGDVCCDVAAPALKAKNYDAWTKQFVTTILANETLELMRSPSTGECRVPTNPSATSGRVCSRRPARPAIVRSTTLRKKYAPRQAALDERLRRAQQAVERESQQATGQKLQTAISVGATLVGALIGRKAMSASTLGRATTAARGVGRTMKESEDIARAQETASAVQEQRQALDDDLKAETAALEAAGDPATETFERSP